MTIQHGRFSRNEPWLILGVGHFQLLKQHTKSTPLDVTQAPLAAFYLLRR